MSSLSWTREVWQVGTGGEGSDMLPVPHPVCVLLKGSSDLGQLST